MQKLQPLATADGGDLEANLPELVGVDEQTAIKDESGLRHCAVDGFPVNLLELLPFGGNDHGFGSLACLQGRVEDGDGLLD